MTKHEAIEALNGATASEAPSRMNPGITRAEAIQVIRDAVETRELPTDVLPEWLAHRVQQVAKNQRRP